MYVYVVVVVVVVVVAVVTVMTMIFVPTTSFASNSVAVSHLLDPLAIIFS
ncbi:hypothetical protein PP707_00220 [Acetobacter pasteurianus]|nr:hypothetical protein [Acetobacter pasteurianus]